MAALYQVQVVLSKEMGNKHGKDVSPDLLAASVRTIEISDWT